MRIENMKELERTVVRLTEENIQLRRVAKLNKYIDKVLDARQKINDMQEIIKSLDIIDAQIVYYNDLLQAVPEKELLIYKELVQLHHIRNMYQKMLYEG